MSVWKRSKATLLGLAILLWGAAVNGSGRIPPREPLIAIIPPVHNWTVTIAGWQFGVIQLHQGETSIRFASMSVDVPLEAPATAGLLAGVFVVAFLIGAITVSTKRKANA